MIKQYKTQESRIYKLNEDETKEAILYWLEEEHQAFRSSETKIDLTKDGSTITMIDKVETKDAN